MSRTDMIGRERLPAGLRSLERDARFKESTQKPRLEVPKVVAKENSRSFLSSSSSRTAALFSGRILDVPFRHRLSMGRAAGATGRIFGGALVLLGRAMEELGGLYLAMQGLSAVVPLGGAHGKDGVDLSPPVGETGGDMDLKGFIVNRPFIPSAGNVTPQERTPWGGRLIGRMLLRLGIKDVGITGELWAISGHKAFPSKVTVDDGEGTSREVALPDLIKAHPLKILGAEILERFGPEMPFLVKILNSGSWLPARKALSSFLKEFTRDQTAGIYADQLDVDDLQDILKLNNHELYKAVKYLAGALKGEEGGVALRKILDEMVTKNLSIQIHPEEGNPVMKPGEHSKTEAWIIKEAEEGAGLYIGLKEGVTEDQVGRALKAGEDISDFMNFIPVKTGDKFFIPAGTPHAIGAAIKLIEPQETSETTYRYYDWGRKDDKGRPRTLHVEEALAATRWDGLRGDAFIASIRREPILPETPAPGKAEQDGVLREFPFSVDEIIFRGSGHSWRDDPNGRVEGLLVTDGEVEISWSGGKSARIRAGESVIVSASSGDLLVKNVYPGESRVVRTFIQPGEKVAIGDLMKKSEVAFGTSGARGLVDKMTDKVSYAYTLGFMKYLESRGEIKRGDAIGVGQDLRPSSPRISAAIVRAIIDRGYKPEFLGNVPTPATAEFGKKHDIATIEVTGSHIPADRNGIKFYLNGGLEVLKPDEAGMKAQEVTIPANLFDEDGMFRDGLAPKLSFARQGEVEELYLDRYRDFFPQGFLKGLRLGVFTHSSVGRDMLMKILKEFGADVTELGRSETFVPVDTEAIRKSDRDAAKGWAEEHKFDAIVGTDGDSDRPFVVDENGKWMGGDVLGIIVAKALGADAVVTPKSSNSAVELSNWFRRVSRTDVGSPFVIEGMSQLVKEGFKRVVSYEANGGFLTATPVELEGKVLSPLPTRDSFIAILSTLWFKIKEGVRVSELFGRLPPRFTYTITLKGTPPVKVRNLLNGLKTGEDFDPQKIEGWFSELKLGRIERIDPKGGPQMFYKDGFSIFLRPSGNEPATRIYVEASSEEKAEEIAEKVAGVVSKSIAMMVIDYGAPNR